MRKSPKLKFVFVAIAAFVSGCGSAANDKVTIGNGSGAPKNPVTTKPIPVATETNFNLLAMEELMRYRHVALYMIKKPTTGRDFNENCLAFDTRDTGVRYLSINYDKCHWTAAAIDSAAPVSWTLKGTETFTSGAAGAVSEIAALTLAAQRTAGGTDAFSFNYDRKSTLTPSDGGAFNFLGDVTIGDKANNKKSLWTSHLESKWREAAGAIKIGTAEGELRLTSRAANTSDQALPVTTYTFAPKSDVTFDGDGFCLRPIGSFAWTKVVDGKTAASGTFTSAKDGLHNGAQVLPWSSCLEMSPL